MIKYLIVGIASLCITHSAHALTYKVSNSTSVVGEYQKVSAKSGDTLFDIAERYDIGVHEITAANPGIKLESLLSVGYKVILPAEFRLPSGPKEGIVLNLAKMRIYYYSGDNTVKTYPVGVGRQGWATPKGTTSVVSKEPNPTWYPPDSLRREAASHGKRLPAFVPPGPHNPLGHYAMHLGFKNIVIHGTNQPNSVGERSSHGCIRMYAEDLKELFNSVTPGTIVRIVYEP
jgi:L,D-transpeptidase ErfK/SrfK